MLNIWRISCLGVITYVVLNVFGISYAEGISHTKTLKLPCNQAGEDHPVMHVITNPGDGTRILVKFDGLEANGYTQGLITKPLNGFSDAERANLSKEELDILNSISFKIEAMCLVSPGKAHSPGKAFIAHETILPGQQFSCEENESVLIILTEPKCISSPYTIAIFTVTMTKKTESSANATTIASSPQAQKIARDMESVVLVGDKST